MAQIVTITNPLTGQPAQVDQLDHTAQQIDDAVARALPGGYYDKWVSQLVNPNLLDNWYFGNPVDQRQGRVVKPNTTYYSDKQLTTSAGTTSAYVTAYRYTTGTASGVSYASFKLEDSNTAPTYYAAPENVVRGYVGSGYGIDRWSMTETSARTLIHDGTVTFEANNPWIIMGQPLEYVPLDNVWYTVSALVTAYPSLWRFCVRTFYTDGSFEERVQDLIGVGLNSYTLKVANNTNKAVKYIGCYIQCRQSNASITLKAMKLELGDTQTLAHQENGVWVLNEIPDYGEQLARCQRYLRPLNSVHCAVSKLQNTRYYLSSITYPTMRTTPTISIEKVDNNVGIIQGTQFITATELDVASVSDSVLTLYMPSSVAAGSAAEGKIAEIFKIWLKAEL